MKPRSTTSSGPSRTRQVRQHQLGAERNVERLPILHKRPSVGALARSRIAIGVTIFAWMMYVLTTVIRMYIERDFTTLRVVIEALIYLLTVTFLCFSALMYLLSRQGALIRFRSHRRVTRAELDHHFSHYEKGITVLIPSYVEDVRVVEKTIWSAVLQEFPQIQVVLLIDDPPNPSDPHRIAELNETRRLGALISAALAEPYERFVEERTEALARIDGTDSVRGAELTHLCTEYRWAIHWLAKQAERWEIRDHTDRFFIDNVLLDLAADLRLTVTALEGALEQREKLSSERVEELYNRLVCIFSGSVRAFERKKYASLSHEANKAMNLNAYISLMGKRLKRIETPRGVVLRPALEDEFADLLIPDTEYILTLDADSMLLRDYCLRLVYLLEQPGNEQVAVVQTPYSSYRGAPTRMERIAAATTDVQHILHQGLTHYDATFWVGANAIIRKRALQDIAQVSFEGDNRVTTYIQDRTVIEDTESSVDLGLYGWHLVNYPERLSYSATPPDFGSLVIQRRRWANGGLLILPKFLRQRRARRGTKTQVRPLETLLRVNYMASIAWASVGLILLLGYPFDSRLLSPWVIIAAAPYFLSMSQDLKDNRYKRTDVFRIYAFNLILLAVNTSGTLKSIQQGITNEKIPFARTPKVANRTSSPWLFVFAPLFIVFYSAFVFVIYFQDRNWGNAIFAIFNASLCLFGIVSYIGIWPSIQDLFLGLLSWFFVPTKNAQNHSDSGVLDRRNAIDWRSMIYYGQTDPDSPTGTTKSLESAEVAE